MPALMLTDNMLNTMLSVYDESEGTTRPVTRGGVLDRLTVRKLAMGDKTQVSRGSLSTLIADLESLNMLDYVGKTDICAVHTIVGFRTVMLRKFVQRYCLGATGNLLDPAVRVLGTDQLKRYLHEHQ